MSEKKNPSKLLIELHYLPCVDFFSTLKQHDTLVIEACENYQKQSYRNRSTILTAQKREDLNIPVLSGNSHLPIKEIRIDYQQKWQQVHQRAIRSAYGKSPFFEFYEEAILKLYDTKTPYLFDFNLKCLTVCLNLLNWKKNIEFTSDYQTSIVSTEEYLEDKRGQIHPKKLSNQAFKPYQQVFGKHFEPNLSILDLLFCEGNNSGTYLNK